MLTPPRSDELVVKSRYLVETIRSEIAFIFFYFSVVHVKSRAFGKYHIRKRLCARDC